MQRKHVSDKQIEDRLYHLSVGAMLEKCENILKILTHNPIGSEVKWSLFYSAVLSGNPDLIKPFPLEYLDKTSNEVQVELLQDTASQIPAFSALTKIESLDKLPDPAVELLHWVLIRAKDPLLTPVAPADYHPHLQKSLSSKPRSQWPQLVLQVTNGESNGERRFQEHKDKLGEITKFAYHGSKLESFYSITNYGLAQHLCKRDLYGEGAYLSTAMDVALTFAPQGTGWTHSPVIGEHFSCVGLCEYVPHPLYIRNDPKKVPKSYVILTNNEIVRLRYILIFAKRRRPRCNTGPSQETHYGPRSIIGFTLYLLILGLIGFFGTDRGSFSYMRAKMSNFWGFCEELFLNTKNK